MWIQLGKNNLKRKIPSLLKILLAFSLLSSSFSIASCRLIRLESKLDPESREFYSTVRYIISKEEKKIILELPPSEIENFIKNFWKRRDPTPLTEENEFKAEYLDKIEMANKLFQGGGKLGYIQDRGRIYMLLGPPDERYAQPVGKYSRVKSSESWIYYKKYRIRLVFIDHFGDGEYTLERPSTWALYEINMAQLALQNPEKFKEELFDFKLAVKKTEGEKAFILAKIPYKNIWFVEKENKLETTFGLSLEILDSSGKEIWQYQKEYKISLTDEEVMKLFGKNYVIEIPLQLKEGSYSLKAILENKIEDKKLEKELKFSI